MGVRRAQHVAERHAGQDDVAHIAALALDQPRILEPRDALPDSEFTHSEVLRTCVVKVVPAKAGTHTPQPIERAQPMGPGSRSQVYLTSAMYSDQVGQPDLVWPGRPGARLRLVR